MLITSITVYLLVTLLIGYLASRLVKNAEDFVLAGRRLPLPLAASALFATWFGSETILGASSEFVSNGLLGVIEDPFGAALCLLLVGMFFARPLYRMNILTFGDFYREKFGKKAELVAALFLVPSYFGWVAAQFVAIGILLNTVSGIPVGLGMTIGAGIVIFYTYIGGMWAISITDFLQSIIIIGGLLFLAWDLGSAAGGITTVVDNTPEGFFKFTPEWSLHGTAHYLAAWITIGLGSIPQQDIFQRVMASRSEKVAVQSSYLGAFLYLSFGLLPLFIGLCATRLYPDLLQGDLQNLLPSVVQTHSGLLVQIIFFGALLSAIMSTSSGAILAPASILAENLLKPLLNNNDDRKLLKLLRLSVVAVACCSLGMAFLQGNIYDLVAMSSAFSLVSLFVPLVAGLYTRRPHASAAITSMFAGMTVWLACEWLQTDIPSILYGLGGSIAGYLAALALFNKRKLPRAEARKRQGKNKKPRWQQ